MITCALAAALAVASSTETTLDNGLRVVLIPHRANPMIASAVVVGAGVVHEPLEASGASHFLEHLLFNGTTTRSQRELYDAADRIGAYNNATTREDHTLFTLLVPSSHAEEGLGIQADMLFRSTIPAENFEKERKVVLEELARDRSNPDVDREAATRSSLYAGTPIARPVLGTEASLASITREQVVAYYRARYLPGNMTLVVMGDLDPATMIASVRRTFGTARKGKAPPGAPKAWPETPRENVELVPSEAASSGLSAAFPFDAAPWARVSAAAELLLAAASEGEDAPLSLALSARGIEGDHRLALERRVRPWGTVSLESPLPAGVAPDAALEALAEAIRSTRPGGRARARLERARVRAESEAVIARDQIHYFALLRSERILDAPAGSLAGETEALRSLGPADWDEAASLLERGLAGLRAQARFPGAVAGRRSWRPPAADPPAPDSGSVRSGSLPNGLRYVLRRSEDSEVVAMHVAFVPRSAAEPPGLDGITDLLHRVMSRATLVHPAPTLAARIEDLGARIRLVDDPAVPFDDYYTTSEFSWIRLEVPARAWKESVALVGEMVRFPELTAEGMERARAEMIPLAERRATSPRDLAMARLDALLAPGHPLARPPGGTPESLRSIELEALARRHATLAVGRGMLVTLVGPFAIEDGIAALRGAFGGLPQGERTPSMPVAAGETTPSSAEVRREAPQSYLALGALVEAPVEERAAIQVAVAALSDRLAFELRETRGLAYSVSAALRPWGNTLRVDVTLGTRPDNVEEAEAGIREVVTAFRAAPLSADEVSRTVQAVRGRALMRRMTRISLAYEAGMEMLRDREPGDERRALDALETVTPEDVRRAAERYLDPNRLCRVVVR